MLLSTGGSLLNYLVFLTLIWVLHYYLSSGRLIKMVEDNVRALAAENELKKFGAFADEYVNRLDGLCMLSFKDKISINNGDWCSWECDHNILLPTISNYECSTSLGSLCGVGNEYGRVATDNRILSKGNNIKDICNIYNIIYAI